MQCQRCIFCDEEMKLTEITMDTGKKIWAYLCACNDMIEEAKRKEKSYYDYPSNRRGMSYITMSTKERK